MHTSKDAAFLWWLDPTTVGQMAPTHTSVLIYTGPKQRTYHSYRSIIHHTLQHLSSASPPQIYLAQASSHYFFFQMATSSPPPFSLFHHYSNFQNQAFVYSIQKGNFLSTLNNSSKCSTQFVSLLYFYSTGFILVLPCLEMSPLFPLFHSRKTLVNYLVFLHILSTIPNLHFSSCGCFVQKVFRVLITNQAYNLLTYSTLLHMTTQIMLRLNIFCNYYTKVQIYAMLLMIFFFFVTN